MKNPKASTVLLVLAGGLVALGAYSTYDEVPLALVLGWVAFLWYVLPQVTVDWNVVGVAAMALVLFTAGVHWIGRTWMRQRPPAEGQPARTWKFRWSLMVVALVFLLFASGIAMIGITHQVAWLATADEPLYGTALERNYFGGSRGHLQWIGLGMRWYEQSERTLPPGGTFAEDGAMRHSWETHLLPYLSYASRDIDLKRPWNDPVNEKYFKCVLPDFINTDFRTADLVDGDGYGLSHYAANSRVLSANRGMKLSEITDGTSTTLLIGEVNARFKPWGDPANWRDPARGINRSPDGFGGPRHAGGAQFVMADGSVRFVSERVSQTVLQALSTPAGGEEVEPPPESHH